MIQRLRGFAAGPPPDVAEAASLLRLVYLATFGTQLLLTIAVGSLLASLAPGARVPNDVIALVLLAVAFVHLPLGWVFARAAIRAGGRRAALSGVIAAGMLFSIPAWFAALLVLSGQRTLYLVGIMSVVASGYALGYALTGLAARVAAASESPAPESLASESLASESPASESPASESPASESPAPESPAPDVPGAPSRQAEEPHR